MRWDGAEPSDEQREIWREFLELRPANVRKVAQGFDPWTMYRLVETGQRCRVIGFHTGTLNCDQAECAVGYETCALPSGHAGDHDPIGLVTVYIYAEHPYLPIAALTGRNVFGIKPASLVPWTDADEAQERPEFTDPSTEGGALVVTFTVVTEDGESHLSTERLS